MLEYYDDVITEVLPRSLAAYGRLFASTAEDTEHFVASIRKYYGLSFEEFADARNELLLQYDGRLKREDFHDSLVRRIVIDLVGMGYLKIKNMSAKAVPKFVLTEQALDEIITSVVTNPELPEDPHQALIILRNFKLLKNSNKKNESTTS